jgi:glycosyltransferase involved in cell wall biosynthesis
VLWFADFAQQHGAKGAVHVCYLGADAPTFPPSDILTFPPQRRLRLLYLGAMGRSYDLETLVRACMQLQEGGLPIELHIAGAGEKLADLQRIAGETATELIQFHGFLQQAALDQLLSNSDLGVIPMFAESGVAVPYKAGDYLAAGLVGVNSLPGELNELLGSHRCGRFYQTKSLDSLVSALTEYANLSQEELAEAKANARALFEKSFNRAKTYPDFAEWIVNTSKQSQ